MARRVLTFGTFDGFHPGHRFYLEQAERLGELWVVIARDSTVLQVKACAPLRSETERKEAIEREFPTAHVLLGDPEDFLAPIRDVQPDLIALGYDQKLPPGVRAEDIPCSIVRLEGYETGRYKSSLLRESSP